MKNIKIVPLTREAFEPYGDVIEMTDKVRSSTMNNGTALRYWDLGVAIAKGEEAQVVFSITQAKPFPLPYEFEMFEKHPYGTQAFVPLTPSRFMVVVAPDVNGEPGEPLAFMVAPGQGVNYFVGTWHGALVALDKETDFLVVDRAGVENNLVKHFIDEHYMMAE